MAGPTAKDVIALRYRLVHELGKGGMGTVWEAHDDRLNRRVAVKLMARRLLMDKTAIDRFEREAKAVARLLSPHIVQIYDYGIDPQPFMVMELLQGENVSQRLAREGNLPVDEVAMLMRQSARGLATAHEAGIIHRDLKPGNLFIVRDRDTEFVKVVDFGIAKAMRRQVTLTAITTHNQPVGTPQYMSPNQLRAKEDHRDDVWSLAVIAYKALSGVHPFASDSLVTLVQRIMDDPHEPVTSYEPSLPPSIDAVFDKAFAKDREERFQSALEFSQAFDSVLTSTPYALEMPVQRPRDSNLPIQVEIDIDPSASTASIPVMGESFQSVPEVVAPTRKSYPQLSSDPQLAAHPSRNSHPSVPTANISGPYLPSDDYTPTAPPPFTPSEEEESTAEVTLVRSRGDESEDDPTTTMLNDRVGEMSSILAMRKGPAGSGSQLNALHVPTPTPPPAAGTPWPVAGIPPQPRAIAPIAVGIALSAVTVLVFVWLFYPGEGSGSDAPAQAPITTETDSPRSLPEPVETSPDPAASGDDEGASKPTSSATDPSTKPRKRTRRSATLPRPYPTRRKSTPMVQPPPVLPPPVAKKKRKKKTGDEAFEGGPF